MEEEGAGQMDEGGELLPPRLNFPSSFKLAVEEEDPLAAPFPKSMASAPQNPLVTDWTEDLGTLGKVDPLGEEEDGGGEAELAPPRVIFGEREEDEGEERKKEEGGGDEKVASASASASATANVVKTGMSPMKMAVITVGSILGSGLLALLVYLGVMASKRGEGANGGAAQLQKAAKQRTTSAAAAAAVASGQALPEQCQVPKDCIGVECTTTDAKCLNLPGYQGLKPVAGLPDIRYRLPSNRQVFAFPFGDYPLLTFDGRYLWADHNGLRYLDIPSDKPSARWDYDGYHLTNRDTGQCVTSVNQLEVTLESCRANDLSQMWIFDGLRFYSVEGIERDKMIRYLSYSPDDEVIILREGSENQFYVKNPKGESLMVEGYHPHYDYRARDPEKLFGGGN